MRERWTYSTARVVATVDGSLGHVVVTGVITHGTGMVYAVDQARWKRLNNLRAVVADMRGATQVVDGEKLAEIGARAQAAAAPGDVPTAFVVRPDQLELFDSYCEAMASLGVMRAAFLDAESAQAWALRQADALE